MRGEDLDTATVENYGFVGDRIYAYVIDDSPNPRLPWMTARQSAEMLLYKPKFVSSNEVEVECPNGANYSINDVKLEKLFEERYGYEISLKHRESGCHDTKPVSILGLQSIKKLSEECGIDDLAPERFRANIYANWYSGEPFLEDGFVGREVIVGDPGVRLRIVKKDSRCVIPTLDPMTAAAFPEVLETIKSKHAGCFGVYAEVVSTGAVRNGDTISLL